MKKTKVPRWIWIPLAVVTVLVLVYFFVFSPIKAGEASVEILDYSDNDAMTIIDNGETLIFCPYLPSETKAMIFYPGARVDYHAYTPLMYQIAQAGIPVVVMKMPLNYAIFAPNSADEIIDSAYFPCENEISEWYLAGHSLGGAMAAQYAAENLDKVTGLILWAGYPAGNIDVTRSQLEVLSIYGSKDMLTKMDEVTASREQFPITATYYGISGANHAQFGDYGPQRGDGEALIEAPEQWRIVSDLTLSFLLSIPLK